MLSYKFSLSPPVPPKASVEPQLVEYSYNEFRIDLPEHWKQLDAPDKNTINFYSEAEGAAIIINVQYFAAPDEKWQGLAEVMIQSRIDAHETLFPGRVEVVHRSIKPHSAGGGLEVTYAAEIPGESAIIFLGYVTSRKILSLQMVCKPDRQEAVRLFNSTMPRFSAKLP